MNTFALLGSVMVLPGAASLVGSAFRSSSPTSAAVAPAPARTPMSMLL